MFTSARKTSARTVLAAVALTVAASGAVPLTSASTASALHPMVAHARNYLGTYQGQCKVFVQKIYAETHANTLGTGYYQAYINAGYHQVSKANVVPGDIIQETNAAHDRGIHTAIVTGDPDGTGIRVIDSNFVAPNKVGEHTYNPTTHAQANGGTAYYWHKG
ncbi:CHAP domain-containing protein [Terrabacter sp. LjRoot27]|uniref:CHAP domain-containing protein n=1 Tax=Terrabacter sp. LjRoot27 TaxID=3342306 RepID=UPI003ECF613D